MTQQQRTAPAPTETRTYGYQDWEYYLASGAGPWSGSPLSWTYDKIGNRMSETRGGLSDGYVFEPCDQRCKPLKGVPDVARVTEPDATGGQTFWIGRYEVTGSQFERFETKRPLISVRSSRWRYIEWTCYGYRSLLVDTN
ncbi:MAG: hypothetical protein U0X73_12270 [Thermoanaerobaculia bacterium]